MVARPWSYVAQHARQQRLQQPCFADLQFLCCHFELLFQDERTKCPCSLDATRPTPVVVATS